MSHHASAKKRKHSYSDEENSEHGTPKKNNSSYFEDEEETDAEVDAEIYAPNNMQALVQGFANFCKTNGKEGVQARYMSKFVADYLKTCEEDVDQEKFTKSYKKYLSLANKSMSMKTSADSILEFLDKGETIKMFHNFPKAPPHLLQFYAKKHNIAIGFGQMGTAKMKLTNDTERRRKCEQELSQLEEKYLADLETFAQENEQKISETQKKFLQHKINTYRKKLHGPTPKTPRAPKTPGKGKKEPQSAFDYYVKTMADKYTDLEPEARERKLTKKFNKLDETTREIFEKIAMK